MSFLFERLKAKYGRKGGATSKAGTALIWPAPLVLNILPAQSHQPLKEYFSGCNLNKDGSLALNSGP